jgi:hypothetical protein
VGFRGLCADRRGVTHQWPHIRHVASCQDTILGLVGNHIVPVPHQYGASVVVERVCPRVSNQKAGEIDLGLHTSSVLRDDVCRGGGHVVSAVGFTGDEQFVVCKTRQLLTFLFNWR